METAQNETKQTEAAPDDSSVSASAGEKDDRQNDRSTSAFLDLAGASILGGWESRPPDFGHEGLWGLAGGSQRGRGRVVNY